MRLRDHPGFFGLTSQGVIAIHADWPIYPEEHGADLALLWLTIFPRSTKFKRIDDIDRCSLFLADVKCSNRADPFDERNFHLAIWHEDLLELQGHGHVNGVSRSAERRWEHLRRASLASGPIFRKRDDGTFQKIELPPLDEYEAEGDSWPEFAATGLTVTDEGWNRASVLLADASSDLVVLGERIQQLRHLTYFDTAVREACVALEHQIKSWLGTERWGDSLIEELVSRLRESDGLIEAHLRVLRGEIRSAFKFIRNDFMHNFVSIDATECSAVLFRLARIKQALERVAPVA